MIRERQRATIHLSDELLRIILLYFTNTFQGLLFFRTLSRQYKNIAEKSLLWLTSDLTFPCSWCYYKAVFPDDPDLLQYHYRTANFHFNSVVSIHVEPSFIPANRYHVTITRALNQGPPLDLLPVNESEALKVCKAFLHIFRTHQEAWELHGRYRPFFMRLQKVSGGFLFRGYILFALTVGILCQVMSCYYLLTISNTSFPFTTSKEDPLDSSKLYAAFICMYIYALVYLVMCLMGFCSALSSSLISKNNLLVFRRSTLISASIPWISTIALIVGLTASIACLQYKLFSKNNSFLFSFTVAPVWCSYAFIALLAGCCLWSGYTIDLPAMIGLILTSLIAFSLPYSLSVLLTLRFDDLFPYSLSCASYPLYFIPLAAGVAAIVSGMHYFMIVKDLLSGKAFIYRSFYPSLSSIPETVVILSIETLRVVSFWGMLALSIFALLRVVRGGGVSVVEGLLCSIAWSLCFCSVLYVFGFTTNHYKK